MIEHIDFGSITHTVKWFDLCCAKTPLLVPSLEPAPLISQHAAEEIDGFATMFWTFIVGSDKIRY